MPTYLSFLQIQPIGCKLFKALRVILNRSDVESFFWALEQLYGSFSDIGAHQDFQKPEKKEEEKNVGKLTKQILLGAWD